MISDGWWFVHLSGSRPEHCSHVQRDGNSSHPWAQSHSLQPRQVREKITITTLTIVTITITIRIIEMNAGKPPLKFKQFLYLYLYLYFICICLCNCICSCICILICICICLAESLRWMRGSPHWRTSSSSGSLKEWNPRQSQSQPLHFRWELQFCNFDCGNM